MKNLNLNKKNNLIIVDGIIKFVAFRGTIRGNGIVNFDQPDLQKEFMNKNDIPYLGKGKYNNNHKLSKKDYYRERLDGKEKINFHLKISSQCLRRNILGNRNYTQLDWQKELSALARICTPQENMRGYMATSSQIWNYNKQSSIYISPAIDKDAVVTPEWGVNGNEIKQKENEDVSSTGIYIIDSTGKTEYDFHGTYQPQIDQFLCIDSQGKMNCPKEFCESNNDNTPLAQSFIKFYGRKPYTWGQFVQNIKGLSRYQTGCMFDNEYINYLFKTFIGDLKNFSIRRTTGYVAMDKLEIAFITEAGTPESEYKWIDVNDIDWNQTFNFHQYWRQATQEEIDMIDKDSVRIEEQVETTSPTKTRSKSNPSK